jgi:hypothetical protein
MVGQILKLLKKQSVRFLLAWTLVVLIVLLFFWVRSLGPSPVPNSIKQQVNFKVIYPKNTPIDSSSWKYTDVSHSLAFNAKIDNISVIFTEQKTPLAYQDDRAAYDRFIGSLRPFANFNTPLGTVSLAHFVTSGDYSPIGQTAILNTHDTLLLAHPDKDLTDDQWQRLFKTIKVDS